MSQPAVTPWSTALRRTLTDGLLTLLIPLLLLLPWSVQGLSHLGRLIGFFCRKPRALAEAQLQAALGCSAQAASHLTLENFAHLGRSLGELLLYRRLGPRSRIPGWLEGAGHLLGPLREGRSVVLLTGHLGNWELLGQIIASVAAQADAPLEVIYRPLRQSGLNRRLVEDRAHRGIGLLARGPDTEYEQLRQRLSASPVVMAFLIDQDLRAPGLMVPFFHAPAHTPTAPLLLALDAHATLVTAFTWRDPDGRHEVLIEPLPALEPGTPEALEAQLMARLRTVHTRLEARIRETPEQWVWFHARWRSLSRGWWPSGRPGGPDAASESERPAGPGSGITPSLSPGRTRGGAMLLALSILCGCPELPTPVLERSSLRIEGLQLTQVRGPQRRTASAERITGQTEPGMAHERARASWLGGITSLQATGVKLEEPLAQEESPPTAEGPSLPPKKVQPVANPFLGAPLQLEADHMTGPLDGTQVELTGKVRLILGDTSGSGGLEVRADRLKLRRRDGKVTALTAEGACHVQWQGRKARAERLAYLPEASVLELRGSAVVEEPGQVLEAQRILLGLADRTLTCEGCRVRWSGTP